MPSLIASGVGSWTAESSAYDDDLYEVEDEEGGRSDLPLDEQAAILRGALRDQEEFAALAFAGLDVIEPGVVLVSGWRPEPGVVLVSGWRPEPGSVRPLASEVNTYGGVARKP